MNVELFPGVGHGQHFALAKDALYLSSVWGVIETSGSLGGYHSSRQTALCHTMQAQEGGWI